MRNLESLYQHNDFSGKIVECFAFICAGILLGTVFIRENLPLLMVVGIYLCVVLFVVHFLVKQKILFSPTLFAFLISVGFVLKLSVQIENKGSTDVTGWEAIGTFDFSLNEMAGLLFVVVCGLSGILMALFSFNRFIITRIKAVFLKYDVNPAGVNGRFWILIIIWFVLYLLLILLMWKLDIGRHGFEVSEEQRLPFKLVGIMTYLRGIYFPATAFIIMDLLVFKRRYTSIWIVFVLLMLLLSILAVVSFTRSAIIIPISLFVMFILSNYRSFGLRIAKLFTMFALIVVVAFFIMSVVDSVRTELYAGSVGSSGVDIATVRAHVPNIDAHQVFALVGSTLTSRIEGTRELMAVYSSSLSGFAVFLEAFFGTNDTIYPDIFGFSAAQEGRTYGMTIGMLGLLFVGKSYLLVFVGSFLYTYLFMMIEYVFLKRGYRMTGFYLSAIFVVLIWMNMIWFFLIRYLVIAVFVYITIVFIEKQKGPLFVRAQYRNS